MKTVILQYNAGNTQSVIYALERLGIAPLVTDDLEEITSADRVIFPGVGEASTSMQYLRQRNLDKLIVSLRQPVLGICLGMQLMCRHSEENNTDCLGIFDLDVKKFRADASEAEKSVKIPHMGWNTLHDLRGDWLLDLPDPAYAYFVHSYYAQPGPDTAALCHYIHPFSAALQKDNFYALQFHPEKSSETGAIILKNFLQGEPVPVR